MDVKKIIVRHLNRETMRRVLLEIGEGRIGRCSPDMMRQRLSDLSVATPAVLLEHMPDSREICQELGISDKGRRQQLIDRILEHSKAASLDPHEPTSIPKQVFADANGGCRPTVAVPVERSWFSCAPRWREMLPVASLFMTAA